MSIPKVKEAASSNEIVRYSNGVCDWYFSITACLGVVKSDGTTNGWDLIVNIICEVKSTSRNLNKRNFMIIDIKIWSLLIMDLQTDAWEEIVHSCSSPMANTTWTKTSKHWWKMFVVDVVKFMLGPAV